ncbi:membrane bound O-acyl transferase family-domain-containing protein [Mycena amicta]|nr:membrane bound O-acyl transferase family-domain-containing protein [Mycena amicta]
MPQTFAHRLALLPITLFCAARASVSLDIAKGLLPANPDSDQLRLAYLNQTLVLAMCTILSRSLFRTFASQTPRRDNCHSHILLDALDLTINLRGIGWNFSANAKIPPETRPLAPRSAFLRSVTRSLVSHILVFDIVHFASQLVSSEPVGSTHGFSIFDPSIPNPFVRHLNALALTLLVGLTIYGAIQIGHDAFALIGVGVFRMSPSEWPPIFNSPWFSTSLSDFWASRWHQVFRQEFVAVGAKPLSLVAGRVGAVFGAFLLSGLLHFAGLWAMNKGADVQVIIFFLTMAVGILLEGLWKRVSGRRVCGLLGWFWTVGWVVGFGFLMVDPWCQSGILGSVFIPQNFRPAAFLHRALVSGLHYLDRKT